MDDSARAAVPAGTGTTQPPYHRPAIISMVLGVCSLPQPFWGVVLAVPALILGVTSLQHVQPRGAKRGRAMAIAGIVCAVINVGVWLVLGIVLAKFYAFY